MLTENLEQKSNRHHLFRLLMPEEPLHIKVNKNDDVFYIALSKEQMDVRKTFTGEIHIELSGEDKIIQRIIQGEIKLQKAIERNQVQLDCNYRTMLLLESIFWLNRIA